MSEFKHTPEPRNIYFNSQDNIVIRKMFADGQESHSIAVCHSGFANARLIAAAPELLEALQEVFSDADKAKSLLWINKAAYAIAKATGETET